MRTLTILVVEDDDAFARLVTRHLASDREVTFNVVRARSLGEAIAFCHDDLPDLILLDLGLPDSTGLGSIRRLKEAATNVPIVVLTAAEDTDDVAIQAIECGAQEWLSKLQLFGDLLRRAIRISIARQRQLTRAQAEAYHDPLTGMSNRRAFDMELERAIATAERDASTFSVAIVDIDRFKRVNDTYGHEAGDAAIRHVGNVLRDAVRQHDTVARYGGEEFAFIFKATTVQIAHQIMSRLQAQLAASPLEFGNSTIELTFSAGIAEASFATSQDIVPRADAALYEAKSAGRNCIRMHGLADESTSSDEDQNATPAVVSCSA